MRSRLMRVVALGVAATVFSTGCMLSRAVDRAFLGISVRRPSYVDRKTTGVFLLPLTFAVDVATFPIQALLVVILGDNFPFTETEMLNTQIALNTHPNFKKLNDQQKATAIAELNDLFRSGQVTPNTALALGEDGHWTLVTVDDEARAQLLARAQQPVAEPVAVCVAQP